MASSTPSKNAKKSVGKEFLCKVRYQNPLPEVPFPPKLLPIPPTYVDPNAGSYSQARLQHYVEYRHTTLEEATPYTLFVDADYGMPIDPCLLGAFDDGASHEPQQLDERDMFLFDLPTGGSLDAADANGDGVSTREAPNGAVQQLAGGAAAGLGQQSAAKSLGLQRTTSSVKRTFDHSREGQLQAIEESFRFFAKYNDRTDGEKELLNDLKHPTNSKLRAVEASPIFPDEDLWANSYFVFSLDSAPEPDYAAESKAMLDTEERQALGDRARASLVFRPRERLNQIGENEQWIECFLPGSEETARRIRHRMEDAGSMEQEDEDVEYRFEKSLEYSVPARTAANRQRLYMITQETTADSSTPIAKYVPIVSREILKRRMVPSSARRQNELEDPNYVSSLALQLRDFSEEELQERLVASSKLHEVVKEEIIRLGSARMDDDSKEDVDVDDELFSTGNKHRRTPSYSSSPID
ncbi:hypothetical protein EV174_003821 [Coemansia sp. RSA 2320]|nr:hypothetical protein EV174_003821 [Coemansia sp. RSA 2320]